MGPRQEKNSPIFLWTGLHKIRRWIWGLEAGLNFYTYVLNNPLRYTDPDGLVARDAYDAGADAVNWTLEKGAESTQWYADKYNETGAWYYGLGGVVSSTWTPETFTSETGERAVAAAKAELGIVAGSAQLAYAYATKGITGKAIGAHGVGNYLGSIGDLSNIIYGGDRDWNVTKQVYETASKNVTGDRSYGTAAFYATDLAMGTYMAMQATQVADKVRLSNGVELERFRNIPAIATQSAPVIFHDLIQLGISIDSAIDNSPNKKH